MFKFPPLTEKHFLQATLIFLSFKSIVTFLSTVIISVILILSVKQANLLTGLLSTDFTSEKLMHDFLFEKVLIYDDNRVHLYTAEKHQEMKMDYKARKKFEALFLSAIAEGKDDSLLSVAQNVQLF